MLYGLLRKYGEDEAALVEFGAAQRAEAERLRGTEAERARRHQADAERLGAAAHAVAKEHRGARTSLLQALAGR